MNGRCALCNAPVQSGTLCPECREKVLGRRSLRNKDKHSKYNAIRVSTDEGSFDSKLEYRRWRELVLLEKAGEITELQRQHPFVIIPKSEWGNEVKYVADFVYMKDGTLVVEDTKSEATATALYKIKKRLMAERYGIIIKEIMKKGTR